jgi:excisionase family DNA binding protein
MITRIVRREIERVLDEARRDSFLSAADAAKLAHVSEVTIRRWLRSGKLTEHRTGRIVRVSRTDLERLLRSAPSNDLSPEQRALRDFG